MKRAALYMRVSTVDQHPETQLFDLRQMATQRGYEIVAEYTDKLSRTKAKRPGLDQMMADARRGRFDVVLVWACDRLARSTRHLLEALDELNRIGVEFVSFRENLDTGGPLGRAIVVIIGAIAELERNLIIERVRAGMRRARLDGQRIGRAPLVLESVAIQQDRQRGQSIRQIAKGPPHLDGHRTARAPQARSQHAGACRMIEESQDFLPIWMLLSAAFGFIAGEACGGQARLKKYLEQANADLRDQLQTAQSSTPDLQHALDQQRRVINDIHKRIVAVTKSLEKHPS
jgi:DNA invertase Pin-like site-specific DNA recombinase